MRKRRKIKRKRHVPAKPWKLYRVQGTDKKIGKKRSFVGKEQNAKWARKWFSKRLKNIRVYRVKRVPTRLERLGGKVKERWRERKKGGAFKPLKEFLFG